LHASRYYKIGVDQKKLTKCYHNDLKDEFHKKNNQKAVYRRTDNTMTKGLTMIYKTLENKSDFSMYKSRLRMDDL